MKALAVIVLLTLTGCATTQAPVETAQTRQAMAYAQAKIGRPPPVRVEWHLFPVRERVGDVWTHTGAGARAQYMSDKTRIVVYVGPNGEAQPQHVYDHEAAHAILREPFHDPRWKKHFRNWVDQ